ncbi:FkbM family methyltransferase [uncultured Massilia sp.]|uniref:FkbM family methyltransferase n=1 Tax=uncultured Massilia sp. TaxID=169973 RepID=UPI0025904A3C|nr:FkbM family methyltransferase [uncultured Massilia sp.]
MQSFTTDSLVSHLGLGNFDPEDAFLATAELYRKDPLFCVPARAREILSRRGADTPIVMLGRSHFGANFMSALGQRGKILAVVDDFRARRGEQYYGVDITTTDGLLAMARQDPDIVTINACRADFSKRYFDDLCRNHGIPCMTFEQGARAFDLNDTLDHRVADWGSVIGENVQSYHKLAQRMGDRYSAETLYGVLGFHLTGNPEWLLSVARPIPTLYFRSGLFSLSAHERMVDCGASVGESTNALNSATQGRFDRSWMIEPDRLNIAGLQVLLRKYAGTDIAAKLTLHQCAVGEHDDEVPFQHLGNHGSAVLPASGAPDVPRADYVRVRRVDDIVDDKPTIIKMDVEGSELAALKGAAGVIRDARPKLMVSGYHRSTDLLGIPAFIDTVAPDYRIGLRHHTEDRWDTCLYFY